MRAMMRLAARVPRTLRVCRRGLASMERVVNTGSAYARLIDGGEAEAARPSAGCPAAVVAQI